MFYWIDQGGSNHSFRELESSQICDKKEPVLLEETAEIKDKSLLPITGFSYGSIVYEGPKLVVTIGKVTCQPNMEIEAKYALKNQLKEMDGKITTNFNNIATQNGKITENNNKVATLDGKLTNEIAAKINANTGLISSNKGRIQKNEKIGSVWFDAWR